MSVALLAVFLDILAEWHAAAHFTVHFRNITRNYAFVGVFSNKLLQCDAHSHHFIVVSTMLHMLQ